MKLYPKKAMASVFILSFLFDLGLLLVVVAVNNPGINKMVKSHSFCKNVDSLVQATTSC